MAACVNSSNSIANHVEANGARSQWISSSQDFYALIKYLRELNPKGMVISFDLEACEEYYDISTVELQKKNGVNIKAASKRNWPLRSREVVIRHRIPREAITVVTDGGELFETVGSRIEAMKLDDVRLLKKERIKALRNGIDLLVMKNDYTIDSNNIASIAGIINYLDTVYGGDWGRVLH